MSFAALPTGTSRYLIETGPVIHYVSTERDLVPADVGRRADRSLLVLGDPAFDESNVASVGSEVPFRGTRSACHEFESMRVDSLPASLQEVNEIVTIRTIVDALQLQLTADEHKQLAAHPIDDVDAIRALIEAIVLEPDGGKLKITLKGDLAGMLSAARDTKRSPDTGDLFVQTKLVAAARFEPAPTRMSV